jgi:hypothetical protein
MAPHVMRLDDVPMRVPQSGEALVRITAVGICGSDLQYHNTIPRAGSASWPSAPATRFGATVALDPAAYDVVGVLKRQTAGYGVNLRTASSAPLPWCGTAWWTFRGW